MSLLTTPNVSQITVSSTNISGEVTLVAGTNITLTPSGQQITIAASGGGGSMAIGGSITSGTATRVLFEGAGPVLADDADFTFDTATNTLFVPMVTGGTASSSSLTLSANDDAFLNTNTGRINIMERLVFNESWTAADEGSSTTNGVIFNVSGTMTTALSNNIFPTVNSGLVIRYSAAQIISSFPTFQASTTFQPTSGVTDSASYTQFSGFVSKVKYSPDIASGTATTDTLCGYASAPQVSKANAGTVAVTNVYGFGTYMVPGVFVNDLANCTITDLIHYETSAPITSSVTLTNQIGIYIHAMGLGTNRYGYYSDLTASANYWDIYSAGGAQSSHEGLFKFGDNVAPTALVHTTGSTTARSSIRVESGTAPTTPNSGDVWHDSTRQCFMAYCGGMSLGLVKTNFVQTANKNLNTSTTETTLVGTGIGTNTLAANFLSVGKTIKVRVWGFYGTKGSPVGAFTIRFKYGTTTLVTLSPTLTVSLTNQAFNLIFTLTCRTMGATGTVFAQGEGNFYTSASAVGDITGVTTATTTIDTTAASALDVTAQWATSNASNTITSTNLDMEILY